VSLRHREQARGNVSRHIGWQLRILKSRRAFFPPAVFLRPQGGLAKRNPPSFLSLFGPPHEPVESVIETLNVVLHFGTVRFAFDDPLRTSTVHCGNDFDVGFSPYQSARLSRYNPVF
jgi:hypothetical protein